jgi:tripartite-type tricarboxylate transporter receptor subunit TctC
VKALAVTTEERVSALPNVPTMAELGYPSSVSSSWQGLAVPKGTPPAIVDELYRASIHTVSDPEVRQRFAGEGVLPLVSKSPGEFAAFVASETARWAQVVKDIGATAE